MKEKWPQKQIKEQKKAQIKGPSKYITQKYWIGRYYLNFVQVFVEETKFLIYFR